MPNKEKRILFTETVLSDRILELGKQISRDYAGQNLILVGVLKGSLYFIADLSRSIELPIQLDFMAIATYPHTTNQKGIVRITKDLDLEITGKHVLVIEDIIRTGLTTAYLVQNLQARMPASVSVCTLFINPDQQLIDVPIAYWGFEIADTRLVGFGMDINENGRNLPYVAEWDRNAPME
ncbi:MAG: hypoxanthine phosphoribosyltransferase [Clostridiaceae bacterium]|nr:hypoxanthine phosphoribosyltransferase [Clostridiaceae bacterium]